MALLIITIAIILYANYQRVDVDETREGDLLLWYGRKERKYIKLWKNRHEF